MNKDFEVIARLSINNKIKKLNNAISFFSDNLETLQNIDYDYMITVYYDLCNEIQIYKFVAIYLDVMKSFHRQLNIFDNIIKYGLPDYDDE
jgi:hypothetical protein